MIIIIIIIIVYLLSFQQIPCEDQPDSHLDIVLGAPPEFQDGAEKHHSLPRVRDHNVQYGATQEEKFVVHHTYTRDSEPKEDSQDHGDAEADFEPKDHSSGGALEEIVFNGSSDQNKTDNEETVIAGMLPSTDTVEVTVAESHPSTEDPFTVYCDDNSDVATEQVLPATTEDQLANFEVQLNKLIAEEDEVVEIIEKIEEKIVEEAYPASDGQVEDDSNDNSEVSLDILAK